MEGNRPVAFSLQGGMASRRARAKGTCTRAGRCTAYACILHTPLQAYSCAPACAPLHACSLALSLFLSPSSSSLHLVLVSSHLGLLVLVSCVLILPCRPPSESCSPAIALLCCCRPSCGARRCCRLVAVVSAAVRRGCRLVAVVSSFCACTVCRCCC